MSLDGFITAPHDTREQALGEDGQRLHARVFDRKTGDDAAILDDLLTTPGAPILGRRSYDNNAGAAEGWPGRRPARGPIRLSGGSGRCQASFHRPAGAELVLLPSPGVGTPGSPPLPLRGGWAPPAHFRCPSRAGGHLACTGCIP